MLNNDFIRGYVQALENIENAISEETISVYNAYGEGLCTSDEMNFACLRLNSIERYIEQVKENYKQLVKDLNENQSKKTT